MRQRTKFTLATVLLVSLGIAGLVYARFSRPEIDLDNLSGQIQDDINVLLVVIDTERADYTSLGDPSLKTTPFLAKIAREGITFRNAFVPAPWTVPSMFSIFTGLYPSEHGVTRGVAGSGQSSQVLSDEATTLAEHLKQGGYDTFGINTNLTLQPRFGFGQGFDRFVGKNFAYLPYPQLVLSALAPEIKSASKYFLWLHYFDPHQPYHTYEPWFSKWNDSRFRTYDDLMTDLALSYYRTKLGMKDSTTLLPEHVDLVHRIITWSRKEKSLSQVFKMFRAMPKLINDQYEKFLKSAYSSAIREVDEAMKEAFEKLEVNDNTLVIITSDHGEELLERGDLGHHVNSLHEELIHIPLVIRLPGKLGAGTVIDTPVSAIDIAPTILDLLGMPVPDEMTGISLKPLIETGRLPARPIYSEVDTVTQSLRCLIEHPWKYIYNMTTKNEALYQLVDDPEEKNNLSKRNHKRTTRMRNRLFGWMKTAQPRWTEANPMQLSKQDIEQLRALGYAN